MSLQNTYPRAPPCSKHQAFSRLLGYHHCSISRCPGLAPHPARAARVCSFAARTFPVYGSLEGWAHYAEELIAELTAAEPDARYPLAHLRMAILRDCRYLNTLNLHTGRASLDDAATFVAEQTGFSLPQARQEAVRGLIDPGYLGYTLGKVLLQRLRDDYARQEGERFTLRRFHEQLFSLGALPLPLLRQAMLAPSLEAAPCL